MARVSLALRERLGEEAARDLEEYAEGLGSQWKDEVMQTAAERFDNRLATVAADLRLEMAGLRLDLAGFRSETQLEMAGLRLEMAGSRSDTQNEMQRGFAGIRQELADHRLGSRQELADLRLGIRQEMADTRVELLRWSFLFWIGQVAVVASLLALMLRLVTPK